MYFFSFQMTKITQHIPTIKFLKIVMEESPIAHSPVKTAVNIFTHHFRYTHVDMCTHGARCVRWSRSFHLTTYCEHFLSSIIQCETVCNNAVF